MNEMAAKRTATKGRSTSPERWAALLAQVHDLARETGAAGTPAIVVADAALLLLMAGQPRAGRMAEAARVLTGGRATDDNGARQAAVVRVLKGAKDMFAILPAASRPASVRVLLAAIDPAFATATDEQIDSAMKLQPSGGAADLAMSTGALSCHASEDRAAVQRRFANSAKR